MDLLNRNKDEIQPTDEMPRVSAGRLPAGCIFMLATNNPGKAKEIRPMFEAAGLTLISLADLGLRFEVREDGNSFLANAMQKARETAEYVHEQLDSRTNCKLCGRTQGPPLQCANCNHGATKPRLHPAIAILADDSGLEIDALGGAPGVDSAFFMGRDTPYQIKNQAILDKLADIPDQNRTARFICQLVCLMPDGTTLTTQGTIEGRIAHALSGQGGFGYDPIFYHPPHAKTLAELSGDEKNAISHRGQAIQTMIGLITDANTCN